MVFTKVVTGDENLLNEFLTRKQGLYAGTDISVLQDYIRNKYICKTAEARRKRRLWRYDNESTGILCERF